MSSFTRFDTAHIYSHNEIIGELNPTFISAEVLQSLNIPNGTIVPAAGSPGDLFYDTGTDVLYTADSSGTFVPTNGGPGIQTNNMLYVATNGDDATALPNRLDLPYRTIRAALAASSAGTCVLVYPGDYVESAGASLVVPPGVVVANAVLTNRSVVGTELVEVSIDSSPTIPVFELQTIAPPNPLAAAVYGILAKNATGVGGVGFHCAAAGPGVFAFCGGCVAQDCNVGFLSDGALNAGLQCEGTVAQNLSITPTLVGGTIFPIGFHALNSGLGLVLCPARGAGPFGPFMGTGMLCEGASALIQSSVLQARFCHIGFSAKNGGGLGTEALFRASAGEVVTCGKTAATAPVTATATGAIDVGSFGIVEMYGMSINTSTVGAFDLNLDSADAKFTGTANRIRTNFVRAVSGSVFEGLSFNDGVDTAESAIVVRGEFHVGTPAQPSESAFGGGDSTVLEMVVLRYTGATAATDGTFSDDITADVNVSDGVGGQRVFDSGAVGDVLYVGSSNDNGTGQPFPGLNWQNDGTGAVGINPQGGVIGASHFIAMEYFSFTDGNWRGFGLAVGTPGSIATPGKLMSTDGSARYLPHADQVMDLAGVGGNLDGKYQYRFGKFVTPPCTSDWGLHTLNGVSGYWMRFRVLQALTTVPTVNLVKLHTNRVEINADGYTEYFGSAQAERRLPFDVNWFAAAAASPANQDVYVGDFVAAGRVENNFQNGVVDRSGFISTLPQDLDTSKPIRLTIRYFMTTSEAANIQLTTRWAYNLDFSTDPGSLSDVFTGTGTSPAVPAGNLGTITDIFQPVATSGKMESYMVDLDVTRLLAARDSGNGDVLWVTVERDGSDAHTGNFVIVQVTPSYTSWSEGTYTGCL